MSEFPQQRRAVEGRVAAIEHMVLLQGASIAVDPNSTLYPADAIGLAGSHNAAGEPLGYSGDLMVRVVAELALQPERRMPEAPADSKLRAAIVVIENHYETMVAVYGLQPNGDGGQQPHAIKRIIPESQLSLGDSYTIGSAPAVPGQSFSQSDELWFQHGKVAQHVTDGLAPSAVTIGYDLDSTGQPVITIQDSSSTGTLVAISSEALHRSHA